ncbi:uncharacterized protein LOC122497940 [Leptopilina heterotoma]|uniref:uncharacterized protein LOC122497940 n=1 Tax=Leptopilina heterotoma TaxID=63436 RepID=UPI001CA98713|nr:uncharacterized protein LOC122497940 [Leptopilina heterotoma]
MENPIMEKVVKLYNENKWRDIIELLNNCDIENSRQLLWVSPNFKNLSWIKNIINETNLKGIVSVGCGSGLLEWLIQQNCDCDVHGVEIDKSWWCCKYSPPIFLKKITFVSDTESTVSIEKNYALLFCYFNNEPVFLNYLREFNGNVIFVIGPDEGQNRYTMPLPFDKKFTEYGWHLSKSQEISFSKDFICMYVR